jgi:hypothetical protein
MFMALRITAASPLIPNSDTTVRGGVRGFLRRDGDAFENFLLRNLEGLSLLGELIADALDLELLVAA